VLGTLAIVLLTGCAEIRQNPKTTIGALGGGALGGLIAGAVGASGAGIAAGVIWGWVAGWGSSATCWTNGVGGWRSRQPTTLWRRWIAYYRTALRHLRDTPLAALQVAVDGRVLTQDAAVVTVANVETYGGWLRLTPAASPVDGLFDVFVMQGTTKREILAKLLRRHFRLPGDNSGTRLYRGRRVSVAASRSARNELELIPGVLPVLVSPETAISR
jgi:diacylglycerol kinase family enzyme